jgi:hypothetical protein
VLVGQGSRPGAGANQIIDDHHGAPDAGDQVMIW